MKFTFEEVDSNELYGNGWLIGIGIAAAGVVILT